MTEKIRRTFIMVFVGIGLGATAYLVHSAIIRDRVTFSMSDKTLPAEIQRRIGNTPIKFSDSTFLIAKPYVDDNKPHVTINKIYGMYFLNREVALNYCKSIPKKEADGYAIVIDMQYPFVASNHFPGSYVGYYLKNCEDLPEHSICLDQNVCLIKYGNEESQ